MDAGEQQSILDYVHRNHLYLTVNSTKTQGFVGSSFTGPPVKSFPDGSETGESAYCSSSYWQSHLAMTYSGLAILAALNQTISATTRDEIMSSVRICARPDGSFSSTPSYANYHADNWCGDGESDVRFVYCACVIATLCHPGATPAEVPWASILDPALVSAYIRSCQSYEGGFGLNPGSEAQGGATYCAVASLSLLGRLEDLGEDALARLKSWCIRRQVGGYSGRTNKPPDSCYSFWVGGTLQQLGLFPMTDVPSTKQYLLRSCQFMINFAVNVDKTEEEKAEEAAAAGAGSGVCASAEEAKPESFNYCTRCGFCKLPNYPPDVLHTFYSVAWLSMAGNSPGFGDGGAVAAGDAFTDAECAALRVFHPLTGLCIDRKLSIA
jgi:prenyltransferase beta subunit